MRVTLVSNIFPPAVGGPATHIYHLALSLHAQGHAVRAVVCTDDPDGAVRPPFPLTRVSWSVPVPLRYARVFWHTWRAARHSDVVYINGIELPSSLGALVAGTPRVLKVVGDWAWESSLRRGLTRLGIEEFQRARASLAARGLQGLQRLYCRLATVVVVPSGYVGSLVRGWGVPTRKIRVIHNALASVPRTELTRAQAKAALGLAGVVVCNVSRLYAWKKVDELIRMTPAFAGNATLAIVGDGPEQPYLERVAAEAGAAGRVVFAGRQPHERVALYLKAADVFALNTQYEGLSHTLVEARHAGAPIVTTDVGGNRELLRHETNALLVPYGDREAFIAAVNRLIGDPALAARLAAAGRDGLDYFRWERLVDETLHLLETVTGLPGQVAGARA
ncbi:MAG: glycosyltransferase family 4 protein [Actinobacteria bacterium]|nr:glycosyltransferase family 4 protein [Actinomycetota bacterium]